MAPVFSTPASETMAHPVDHLRRAMRAFPNNKKPGGYRPPGAKNSYGLLLNLERHGLGHTLFDLSRGRAAFERCNGQGCFWIAQHLRNAEPF